MSIPSSESAIQYPDDQQVFDDIIRYAKEAMLFDHLALAARNSRADLIAILWARHPEYATAAALEAIGIPAESFDEFFQDDALDRIAAQLGHATVGNDAPPLQTGA